MANIIDLIVLIGGTALGVYGAAMMSGMFGPTSRFLGMVILISQVCLIILIPILIQGLFWMEGTTVGKMLVITEVRTLDGNKIGASGMFAREYLSKVFTCYIGCLPILFKKPAIYETATNSRTIIKPRGNN